MSDPNKENDHSTRQEAIALLLRLRTTGAFTKLLDLPTRMTGEQARLRQEANREANELASYRAELEGLTDDELRSRVRAARELIEKKEEAEEQKFHFNKPSTRADVNYWSVYPHWTIDEGIALVLDRDPRLVKWDAVKPYVSVSKVAKQFSDLLSLAARSQSAGILHHTNQPGVFLRWVERSKFEIPPHLRAAVEANGIVLMDWQDAFAKAKAALDTQSALIQRLSNEIETLRTERDEFAQRARDSAGPWPWGAHETPLLQHLSAAADRFWKLYDPQDQSTAPTNEAVEEWLVGRGVSKRVAEVMAQILRPDGLKPGRRR